MEHLLLWWRESLFVSRGYYQGSIRNKERLQTHSTICIKTVQLSSDLTICPGDRPHRIQPDPGMEGEPLHWPWPLSDTGNCDSISALLDVKIMFAMFEPVTLGNGGDDVDHMTLVWKLCRIVWIQSVLGLVLEQLDQDLHL